MTIAVFTTGDIKVSNIEAAKVLVDIGAKVVECGETVVMPEQVFNASSYWDLRKNLDIFNTLSNSNMLTAVVEGINFYKLSKV